MKQYQKMKDSGIAWIGKIPEHWISKRLKFLVKLKSIKLDHRNHSRYYVGLENIESRTGRLISINEEMGDSDAKFFEKKDILFGKLRPYLAKVGLASFEGRCS